MQRAVGSPMHGARWCVVVATCCAWWMACPTRPMPCRSDADCDAPRNVCDTTQPQDDAPGTCVFRALAHTGQDDVNPGSDDGGTSSGGSSSSGTPCIPACETGQRCVNGLCTCDSESCAMGCCANNHCRLTSFTACAGDGDTCLSCDMSRADNCSITGACRCGSQTECQRGQVCVRGRCECFEATCPGCCQDGQCMDRGVDACGVKGSLCVGCDPVRANGCNMEGMCRCGNGPPCGQGRACINGTCMCNATTCPGCCDGQVCNLASMVACGVEGAQCQACDARRADNCARNGTCQCGDHAQCLEGQACEEGQCVCNQASCRGCCNGNVCEPGTSSDLCGAAGLACDACVNGQVCTLGVCQGCTPQSCPNGCCSANQCYARANYTCGVQGQACQWCSPVQADACGVDGECHCGSGGSCPAGQACVGGSCDCNPQSCPRGCCKQGVCEEPSPLTCGTAGAQCVSCNTTTADYCSPEGTCQCGAGASCVRGQRCVDGVCICDPTSCPEGCCQGDVCQTRTTETCGNAGSACRQCLLDYSDTCRADGTCGCGTGPACGANQQCSGGACTCTSSSCANGCCVDNVCMAPSWSHCGVGGLACVACGANADGCGPNGTCQCGIGAACAPGAYCVDGQCQTTPGSSSSDSFVSSSTTSQGSTSMISSSSSAQSSSARSSSSSSITASSSASSTASSYPNPGIPVVSGQSPVNTRQPTWTWVSGGNGAGTYRYKLDSADFLSGFTETTATTFTPTTNLDEGAHTLYVLERNAVSVWSSPGSATVTIDVTPPAEPVLTGTNPVSPASSNDPLILGSAEFGTTVRLFTNSTCTPPEVASGSAEELAATGLLVHVENGTTTEVWGTATDVAGNLSPCSTTSVTYTQQTPGILTLSGASTEYGGVNADATGQNTTGLQFTVQNTGGVAATNITTVGLGGAWSRLDGTCGPEPFSLNAGATCTLIIVLAFNKVGPLSTTVHLAYNGGISNSLTLTGVGLPVVEPAYSVSNGNTWTWWFKRDLPTADIWHQSGTPCDAETQLHFTYCFHAADKLKVAIHGQSDCAGLTIGDSFSAFDWQCLVDGGTATFFSTLKQDKGMGDLLQATGFKNGSVTIHRTGWAQSVISASTWWWHPVTNQVSAAPSNTSDTNAAVSLTGAANVARIYVVDSSRATSGYTLDGDHVALVVLPGFTLSYSNRAALNCGNASKRCITTIRDRDYPWVEGSFCADYNNTAAPEHVILAESTRFGMFRNLSALCAGASDTFFELNDSFSGSGRGSSANRIENVVGVADGTRAMFIANTMGNLLHRIAYSRFHDGIWVASGAMGNSFVDIQTSDHTNSSFGAYAAQGLTLVRFQSLHDDSGPSTCSYCSVCPGISVSMCSK